MEEKEIPYYIWWLRDRMDAYGGLPHKDAEGHIDGNLTTGHFAWDLLIDAFRCYYLLTFGNREITDEEDPLSQLHDIIDKVTDSMPPEARWGHGGREESTKCYGMFNDFHVDYETHMKGEPTMFRLNITFKYEEDKTIFDFISSQGNLRLEVSTKEEDYINGKEN